MKPDRQEPNAHEANDDEPHVDVRAGLLGHAIELLKFCDELIVHLDRPAVGIRRVHDDLAATAAEMQDVLDSAGIIVNPTLRPRPHRHHRA